jgi:hypothetical protein
MLWKPSGGMRCARHAVQVDSGQDFENHIGRLIRSMERFLSIGEERAANEPVKDTIAAVEAAPSIHPAQKTEFTADPAALQVVTLPMRAIRAAV